jgi:hypothetical protein
MITSNDLNNIKKKSENQTTGDNFLDIEKKITETSEIISESVNDPTPFPIMKDGEISVAGDANLTQIKKEDYVISFRVPLNEYDVDSLPEGQIVGDGYSFTSTFTDRFITPRNDLKVLSALTYVQPFFYKLNEEYGGIDMMENKELAIQLLANADQVILAMYNLIASFLDISDDLGQYMTPLSVIGAVNTLFKQHPEMLNEADVFFK